jgi:hypothetical protein
VALTWNSESSPNTPSSIKALTVRKSESKRRLWKMARIKFLDLASSASSYASPDVGVMGFSQTTCLPALRMAWEDD